jgi:prepilin-type N-terminal cleavage/methylation domain-containing protein
MTTPTSHRASRSALQRGLSLVELMVGAAISLF